MDAMIEKHEDGEQKYHLGTNQEKENEVIDVKIREDIHKHKETKDKEKLEERTKRS